MASEVSEGRALLPRQLVTTRHDQHSIRREQRLEPQTVRQRLPGPNREVQLAREQLIERLHVALVSHLESQGRVRLANPSPPPRPPPARSASRKQGQISSVRLPLRSTSRANLEW